MSHTEVVGVPTQGIQDGSVHLVDTVGLQLSEHVGTKGCSDD